MPKRVNVNGPAGGDDPDEYWFECEDCEGNGTVNVRDGLVESTSVSGECPGCGGLGFYEGDANDVELCNKRFHPKGGGADPGAYWYFCREPRGHAGDCDCPAAHEQQFGLTGIVED